MKELSIPPDAMEGEDAFEMLRFWVVDGEDQVSLLVGTMGEEEPKMWGYILADIARHAINAMGQDDPSLGADDARARLEQGFRERLEQRVGITGQIGGTLQ